MGWSKSSSKRGVYSNTILPQETRKTSNRQPHFIPKATGKKRTKKSQNQQKERNHKDLSSIKINLQGWNGKGDGREGQKGGDLCIPMANSG